MAKQAVKVELFYDGIWNDITAADDVFADTPIVITRGDGAESAAPRPATISLRLANDDDRYRTSNPMSPLYGKVGLNTPMRVSVGTSIRGYVEASTWEADETPDFRATPKRGMAWVDVTGGGLLQRIGQWSKNVKSPLRLATENLAGLTLYFPLEDKAGTVYGTPVVPGTSSLFMTGYSFGSQNSPPGGGTAVDRAPGASFPSFIALPGDPASTVGWQANQVVYLGEFGNAVGEFDPIMFVSLMNGWGAVLQMNANAQTTKLRMFDAAGNEPAASTVSTAGYQWSGRWLMVHIEATYSAGTTTVAAYWRGVGESSWSTFSTSFSGVPSDVQNLVVSMPEGSSFGHLAVVKGFASALTSGARVTAFESHPDELAAVRFGRLMDESNVPYYVSTNWGASHPMGPQGIDPLPKQILETRDTDDALIFDFRTEGRVFFRARRDRENQTPVLTLNAAPGQSGMPGRPAEKVDDVPIHNVVTASQRGGGDATRQDDTGPKGTADPPAGAGEYRQTVDVNTADPDTDLSQLANWYLRRGTVNEPRYPTVTVDLTRLSGAALTAVEAVDIGDVILISNYREYTIRLFVLGYVETITTHTRKIVFTCAPDRQFNVGVLDTNRLQARSSTLNAGITSSATSLTLKMTDVLEQWRPGNNAVPVLIGGELITLGTVGAVSGTGPWTQAVTGCTRAVNGIVKAHSAGDPVVVDQPIKLILGEP